jgi:hypothetical protein
MRYLLPLAIILLSFVGCSNDNVVAPSGPVTNTTVALRMHQPTTIPGTRLSMRLDAVLFDGRFPHDSANPLWWYNTAQLQFTLLPSGKKLQLYISGEIPDSAGVRFDGAPAVVGHVAYRMVDLSPLPTQLNMPVPQSELVARIEIWDTIPPVGVDSGGFPLAVGNQWIYLDSSFWGDSLAAVTYDTITIRDEYTDQNGHWWDFSGYLFPFAEVTMSRSDTLFSQQDATAMLPPGNPLYFTSMEFAPPMGDSSQYRIIVEGDLLSDRTVTRLHSTLVTPAGSFADGLRYSAPVAYLDATEILVPGVGIAYMENVANYGNGIPSYTNRMWLSKYSLK